MKIFIFYIPVLLFSFSASAQLGSPTVIDSHFSAQIRNIIAVDIDHDDLKDIVVSYHADSIKWYRNLGENTFSVGLLRISASVVFVFTCLFVRGKVYYSFQVV